MVKRLKNTILSSFLIVTLCLSLVTNLGASGQAHAAAANGNQTPNAPANSKRASLAVAFQIPETDIQTQLDAGYSSNDVLVALQANRNNWIEALKAKPKAVNLSLDHTPEITNHVPKTPTVAMTSTASQKGSSGKVTVLSLPSTGDPTDVNTKPDEAPYSVQLERETVSTLSGGLSVEATDMTLPGRNGLGFSLTRSYNSESAELYGMDVDANGNNITKNEYEQTLFPIGIGWSWNLSSIEMNGSKKYLHLAGSGTFEWDGTSLKGYPWKDIVLASDSGTVTVNGETSAYVLSSIQGIKQYFNSAGLLLQISDLYNNKVTLTYSTQGSYGKVLTTVQDAIGNTITIAYAPDKVTLSKTGGQTVTYYKSTQSGKELLTQVVDPMGRSTWYDYVLDAAQFNMVGTSPNTSNPYALLADVIYPTGGKTVYTYKPVITRYVGSNAVNQAYQIDTREDRIYYSGGTYTAYNHKAFTYSGDMGSSYNQTLTFTTTIDDGLTTAVFTNQKDCSDTTLPPTFYNTNVTTTDKGNTEKRSTTYSFDTARHWYWPIGTSTVTTNLTTGVSGSAVTTSRSFDDYANVTLEVDPMGTRTTYTFDPNTHRLTSVSQPISSTQMSYTAYQRNAKGTITQTVVKDTDANGALRSETNYGIDAYGNSTTITFCTAAACDAANSIVKTVEYNVSAQSAFPTQTTVVAHDIDGASTSVIRKYGFDLTSGNLTSATDALNQVTTYQYDAGGRVTKATHQADGTSVSVQYDDFGNTLTTKDETGVTAVTKWNPLGWKTETGIMDNVGYKSKSKMDYDAHGRLAWAEDALGNRTSYQYDAWNRQTSLTYPDGAVSTIAYDDIARTQTTTDPGNDITKATMDILGRVTQQQETKPSGVTTTLSQTTYDNVGNVRTAKDANTNTTSYQYDVLSRLTAVTDALNETTSYAYDMLGNRTKTTFADGKTATNQYDELGRVIQTTDENSHVEKMYYDANGNETKLIDRNGNRFQYTYTNRGFLQNKEITDASGNPLAGEETISFGYDSAGRRTSMTDATGTTGYAYDPYTGQLRTMTYPDGRTLQYDYDKNGNRQSMTGPFGGNVYYAYDARNRLQAVGPSVSMSGSQRTIDPDATYAYYTNDLLKTITQKNGVTSAYTYDGHELSTLTQKKLDGTVLNSMSYHYDPNKNITQQVENGTTSNETYDPLNRISTVGVGSQSYTYDNRGNRTSFTGTNPADSPDATYGYDKRDRLTSVTTSSSTVTYKYNGDGLLWERTENGQTTRYYTDGADVIAEATVSGGVATLKAHYERGIGLVARQGADNSTQYYLQNGHGDITELRDSTGNMQLNKYTYDIWGNPQTTSDAIAQPFRYSGEMWDNTSKLQYLRVRWYDPSMGRFMTEDTYSGQIDNPLSLNLYTYVENNPLIYTDPTGNVKDSDNAELSAMVQQYTDAWQSAQYQIDNLDSNDPDYADNLSALKKAQQDAERSADNVRTLYYGSRDEYMPADIKYGDPAGYNQRKASCSDCASDSTKWMDSPAVQLPAMVLSMADGAGEAIMITKVTSLIKNDAGLVKAAQQMGNNEAVQAEADMLVKKFLEGNGNPGIGTKNLFGNVNYLRGRNGARVFYRITDGTMEILGKADKAVEQKVINIISKLYGK